MMKFRGVLIILGRNSKLFYKFKISILSIP